MNQGHSANRNGSEVSLNIPSNDIYSGSSDCIIQDDDDKNCATGCLDSLQQWCRETTSNVFRKKTLYKRLPILTWLPKYNRNDFIGDLVAGITVGLTVIPQGLAYAGIAGLPMEVCMKYCNFFFTSKI